MNRHCVSFLVGCVVVLLSQPCVGELADLRAASQPGDLPQASIPAFPGAEGAGAFTAGGRGGKVYVVTTLEDYAPGETPIPGSFRAAAEAEGKRIIVFGVSGWITLKAPLDINDPYVTIAGQSAPGGGVGVRGETTHISTHDVVIRYLRFRRGPAERDAAARRGDYDALGGNPVGNILIDHVSASWGLDENLSIYRHMYSPPDGGRDRKLPTVNVTIQWCISSEALNPNNHAFGATWGGRNTSFHHNLFACNTGRNPSIGMSFDFNFVNNVIFNWRHRTADGGDDGSRGNFINNYYKPGPVTSQGSVRHRIVRPDGRDYPRGATRPATPQYGKWYVSGNVVEGNPMVTDNNWAGGVQFEDFESYWPLEKVIASARVEAPQPMAAVTIQPAKEAYDLVLAGAGATLPVRDAADKRVVESVRTGKPAVGNGIINDPKEVGGWPDLAAAPAPADADGDGMPDDWEKAHGLNPADPSDAAGDKDNDGYTHIEEYLNGTNPSEFVDYKNAINNVNTLKPRS
ncbi:MAG: polysaccharide lyase [Phycisphaerae bacterium]|nr:polysaccharide lyase [Phycisphaerae bacterium]